MAEQGKRGRKIVGAVAGGIALIALGAATAESTGDTGAAQEPEVRTTTVTKTVTATAPKAPARTTTKTKTRTVTRTERVTVTAKAPAAAEGSAYYENCDAARAAGAAPVRAGDPGYGPYLDRDRDGVGCE